MKRIDPANWKATILPLPKKFSRGSAMGFCGGFAVGQAETARAKTQACWWPENQPELLTVGDRQFIGAGRASGDVIPGHWRHPKSGEMSAVTWTLADGKLVLAERHDPAWQESWAITAVGDIVVGIGRSMRKGKAFQPHVGLVWRASGPPLAVAAEGEVALMATDGTRLGGSIDGRATLWATAQSPPVDLAPAGMPMSEICAFDGDTQVGTAFRKLCARTVLWRGSAQSVVDLTPEGFEVGRARGAAQGFQVGFVRQKDVTANGSASLDNKAVIWDGASDAWTDLNALLPDKPSKYNASVAWGVCVVGNEVRVCGEAARVDVSDAGTPRESQFQPVAHPVMWTGTLDR